MSNLLRSVSGGCTAVCLTALLTASCLPAQAPATPSTAKSAAAGEKGDADLASLPQQARYAISAALGRDPRAADLPTVPTR